MTLAALTELEPAQGRWGGRLAALEQREYKRCGIIDVRLIAASAAAKSRRWSLRQEIAISDLLPRELTFSATNAP